MQFNYNKITVGPGRDSDTKSMLELLSLHINITFMVLFCCFVKRDSDKPSCMWSNHASTSAQSCLLAVKRHYETCSNCYMPLQFNKVQQRSLNDILHFLLNIMLLGKAARISICQQQALKCIKKNMGLVLSAMRQGR